MSIFNWIQGHKDLIGKYLGSISLIGSQYLEFIDGTVRVLSGVAGLVLTIVLIWKAVIDIKKNKKKKA